MKRLLIVAGIVPVLLSLSGAQQTTDVKEWLSRDDRKLLDGLLKDFLTDPRGSERVRVKVIYRSVWGSAAEGEREGWLRRGTEGKPGAVVFTDGESIVEPKQHDQVDFLAACRARYQPKKAADQKGEKDVFGRMRLDALGADSEGDLVMAAWLHRLGQDELAARALERAREDGKGKEVAQLRNGLAWSAFAGLVHAYMVRADQEALEHGTRLLRLYAKEAKEYGQAQTIVDELRRRQKNGKLGLNPQEKPPDDYKTWDQQKKVAYWIDQLDEVDARQWSQPGGVNLASDARVKALIEIGDPAVPALIDVIEQDQRLTRSVHFWRDFARSRTVLSVREAGLAAVMSILRVRVFEPVSTGDNLTARGEGKSKEVAQQLRSYWKEYGALPFDERMMKVLTNPKSNFEALREAADNLASMGDQRTLSTTVFSDRRGAGRQGPNPAVAKFKNPTAAEAILAAMDRDLNAHDANKKDELYDYRRQRIEDSYLFPLIQLGDKQIAGELAKRSQAADGVRMRRKWGYAAHWLGETQPFQQFAVDFRDGKIRLPANDRPRTNDQDQPGNVELRGMVSYLAGVPTAEADQALHALANPQHPYHLMVAWCVLQDRVGWGGEAPWFAHPFCLAILRRELENTKPNGSTYKIEEDRLIQEYPNGSSSGGIPAFLADPASRKEQAAGRFCDEAADKLHQLVMGVPHYHALFKDADGRLEEMRKLLDRFTRYRALTGLQMQALGLSPWHTVFVADVQPLGRPATAADVAAGRAIFHLDGKGKLADLKLPAVGILERDQKKEHPPRVLIVQAEVGSDGSVTYGIIGSGAVRAVQAAELPIIEPLEKAP